MTWRFCACVAAFLVASVLLNPIAGVLMAASVAFGRSCDDLFIGPWTAVGGAQGDGEIECQYQAL